MTHVIWWQCMACGEVYRSKRRYTFWRGMALRERAYRMYPDAHWWVVDPEKEHMAA